MGPMVTSNKIKYSVKITIYDSKIKALLNFADINYNFNTVLSNITRFTVLGINLHSFNLNKMITPRQLKLI